MKIQFLTNTYIRSTHTDLDIPPVGVVLAETIIEVDNRMYSGATVDEINLWYRDAHNWYYWSGQALRLESGVPDLSDSSDEDFNSTRIETGTTATGVLPEEDEDDDTQEETIQEEGLDNHIAVAEKNWAIDSLEVDTLYWEKGYFGKDIKVAILDTGIDPNYPDLQERISKYQDFYEVDASDGRKDLDGHGTNCAGLIGGTGNTQLLGIAPSAKLYIGRVMAYRSQPQLDHFIAGLEWALEEDVDIIFTSVNWRSAALSLQDKDMLESMINAAAEVGTLIIAPSGDATVAVPEDNYPACLDEVLSVGAYDMDRSRLNSSIKSYTLDVLAPGGQLNIDFLESKEGEEVQYTGFAAAIVSGLMALVYQYIKQNNKDIPVSEMLRVIRSTATNDTRPTNYRSLEYGWGRINPKGILDEMMSMNNG